MYRGGCGEGGGGVGRGEVVCRGVGRGRKEPATDFQRAISIE